MSLQKVKVSELVFDFDLYPRAEVDSQHIHYMREAYRAGAKLPPPIIDKKSRRIVDGFHRVKMYLKEEIDEIEVEERSYKSERDIFLDSMHCNAGHGRSLTTFDRAHCVLRADQLGIEPEQIATALCITCEAVGNLRSNRVGNLRANTTNDNKVIQFALKRTIGHMAGKTMSKAQYEANGKLSGMQQCFYVNQIITLIENGLLDKEDERLLERLRVLNELLDELLIAK